MLLVTIKRAEDNRGVIVQLIEIDGQPASATLTLPFLAVERAWSTNLVEENQEELTHSEHSVTVPIKAFGIATVRLQVPSQ